MESRANTQSSLFPFSELKWPWPLEKQNDSTATDRNIDFKMIVLETVGGFWRIQCLLETKPCS